MPRIQKLPEILIQRIAAGEVVERPASVLKELVENALDAGARHVTVEWKDAGRKKIRVTDDGHGMSPEDARLALERHATSKIRSLEDLERIGTFGFRGEALPSIAAVSRFRLATRTAEAAEGWAVDVEGGKVLREGPVGAPSGTTVLVEDLFFATPARRKFLKSDATEKGLLLRTVEDIALAARGAGFQIISNGREVLTLRPAPEGLAPAEALRERLRAAWGEERLAAARPVRSSGRFMTVWGWISDVHAHQATGRYQRFYVNGRAIQNRRFSHALYEAYRGNLLVGRHPLAVLFLEVDPTLVDVNVHPAKREVRLSHEEEIHGFLFQSLKEALAGGSAMPAAFSPAARSPEPPPPPAPYAAGGRRESFSRPAVAESRAAYHVQAPLPTVPAGSPPEATSGPIPLEVFREAKFQPLMQVAGTYILARLGPELYIFDQHAAAERVLYEKLSEAADGRRPHRQALLLPWVWEVTPQAAAVVSGQMEDFGRLGYELEPFGHRAFRVKAVPGALGDSAKVRGLIEGLAEDLLQEAIPRRWDAIVVRAACRGSVKAGDPLQLPEMENVLAALQRCRMPWSCPHGRPTFLKISSEELAKRFKRT